MPAFVWAACIYAVSSIPAGRFQWRLLHQYDKLVHLLIFYIFGILVYRALHRDDPSPTYPRRRLLLMLLIVIGYGLFDEIHQAWTPGRLVDLRDFLADASGGVLAGVTTIVYRRLAGGPVRPG